jgi:dethiobiotin synthase
VVTLFVSGSGTDVGKTRVTAALARAARGASRIQIVKPVQTGVGISDPSDADHAARLANSANIHAHTLRRYPAPLTPLAATDAAYARLDTVMVGETLALPKTDLRLIESAGGLAVPLGPEGFDWVDFAHAVHADAVVLVVPDQLGAISQCRTYYYYLQTKLSQPFVGGIFLNEITPATPPIKTSIRAALAACGIPLWGELAFNSLDALLHPPLIGLLGA